MSETAQRYAVALATISLASVCGLAVGAALGWCAVFGWSIGYALVNAAFKP